MTTLIWTDSEAFRMLEVWGEDNTQNNLKVRKEINMHTHMNEWRGSYECIESKNRSVAQLRQEYKKIRDGYKETEIRENSGSIMTRLMGNRPSVKPPVMMDTSLEP